MPNVKNCKEHYRKSGTMNCITVARDNPVAITDRIKIRPKPRLKKPEKCSLVASER